MCLDREQTVKVETKFLHLRKPVALGTDIEGWRVCWLGGWDRGRVFYVVMVAKARATRAETAAAEAPGRRPSPQSVAVETSLHAETKFLDSVNR